MTVTVRPPLLSAPLKKQWGTADVLPNLLLTTLAVAIAIPRIGVQGVPQQKKFQQDEGQGWVPLPVTATGIPPPIQNEYDSRLKWKPFPEHVFPSMIYLPTLALLSVKDYPTLPPKRWVDPWTPAITTALPTGLITVRNPIGIDDSGWRRISFQDFTYQNTPLTPQAPFAIRSFEGPLKPRLLDPGVPQITTSLPTAAPPTHDLYDSGVIPKKLPPYVPVGRRSLPLPSAPSNFYESGVPPKKYPPHMPNRVQQPGAVVPVTVLAQLQTEFDPWGTPKKQWPGDVQYPHLLSLPSSTPVPFSYDYPSRVTVRWPEDASLPNVASLPPMIGLAQGQPDFDGQGPPPKRWAADAPLPNIAAEPVSTIPPIITYEYPSKVRIQWAEDAAPTNVPVQPLTLPVPFSYDYPSQGKKYWAEDAAPQNFWVLPSLALPPALYDWPALPKKVWPEEWIQTNVLQEISLGPITFGTTIPFEYPKQITVRLLPDFQSPYPLLAPQVPIYIPLVGYEIYITPRVFTLATPVRTFSLIVPYRAFTIASDTVQTFDVKDPAESWPLSFNMGPDLFNGETLVGAPTITVNLLDGADPFPQNIINGAAGFDQTLTQVIQPVTGGIAGCTYQIIATCATSNPLKTLTLVGALPVNR